MRTLRWARTAVAITVVNAFACGSNHASQGQDASQPDVVPPAKVAAPSCDPNAAFVAVVRNEVINSDQHDSGPFLTLDGLAIYFTSDRPGSAGAFDLYFATREHVGDDFSAPTPLDEINTPANEDTPFLTPDGLTLYFSSNRPGSVGNIDLYVAKRATRDAKFGVAQNLADLNSAAPARQFSPHLSADGQTLYFASDRTGNIDLYHARVGPNESFAAPEPITEVNSDWDDTNPWVSQDGLTLYFASSRDDGNSWNLWVAQRTTTGDPFGAPEALTGLNTDSYEGEPAPSADGCTVFFSSDRPGSSGQTDIWEAYRPLIR